VIRVGDSSSDSARTTEKTRASVFSALASNTAPETVVLTSARHEYTAALPGNYLSVASNSHNNTILY
jgi:hypothetical protein